VPEIGAPCGIGVVKTPTKIVPANDAGAEIIPEIVAADAAGDWSNRLAESLLGRAPDGGRCGEAQHAGEPQDDGFSCGRSGRGWG